MHWQEAMGYLAGVLTTVAVLPQIRKTWKTREVQDISVFMVVIMLCGLGLWITYGFVTSNWPIVVTDGISFLFNCFLLGLVFHEKRKS